MKSTNTLNDNELIFKLKTGDERAFTEIYNRYWKLLYAHAYKMLLDEEEAKDVVQDTFSSLWTHVEKLSDDVNLAPYLFVATKNKVLNLVGRNKYKDHYISSLSSFFNESSEQTMNELNERDLLLAIEKEIINLPPKMRHVFELSRKSYLSNKEIAEKLNIANETVKKQIHNAIKIIKLNLNNDQVVNILIILSLLIN